MISFVLLVLIALSVFAVPIKGSFGVLVLGTLLYVFATTGFGQLISTFTRTQVSAVFATAILSIIPAVNFSGLLVPVVLALGRRPVDRPELSRRPGTSRSASAPSPRGWASTELWPNLLVLAGFFAALSSSPRSWSCASRRPEMAAELVGTQAPQRTGRAKGLPRRISPTSIA